MKADSFIPPIVQTYKAVLHHDKGKTRITFVGPPDIDKARKLLADAEGCPEHAIKNLRTSKEKIRM